ncbi:hypothetical protein DPEC_G00122690 [Dallia pectoralis]|nr:hypothetical protein DPEC_G00122690 [Dallia pectoralis]
MIWNSSSAVRPNSPFLIVQTSFFLSHAMAHSRLMPSASNHLAPATARRLGFSQPHPNDVAQSGSEITGSAVVGPCCSDDSRSRNLSDEPPKSVTGTNQHRW